MSSHVPGRHRRRHVWVDGADHRLNAGLILQWRRDPDTAGWEALVASVGGRGGLLVDWRPLSALQLLTDDSWAPQP